MNSSDESKRKLVEFLWVEINRAILTSKEVKSSIKILRDLDLLEHLSDYNLVLDVNALVDLIQRNDTIRQDPKPPEESPARRSGDAPGAAPASESPETMEIVDGQVLSPNEIEFYRHMEKNFDESLWMRKAGIRFPNGS